MVETLKWFASLSGILAALIIASDISRRWTGYGFLIFVFSSAAWITAGILAGDPPLSTQNAVLFCINIFGVYRYLIRKKPLPT